MYKVAIIDDEPLIVEGLSKTMAWEKWNCQVAGTASDGKEGMELIREKRPDIVITDINMPKMDGLRMIAGLKSEFPDMQLIILTGYREFEYARQAIALGVTRFLLKPSKMNELEEAVDAVTKRLDQMQMPVLSPAPEGPESVENPVEQAETEENSEANSFIVNHALEYIRSNSREKLRLSDVAEQVGFQDLALSPAYLRKWKECPPGSIEIPTGEQNRTEVKNESILCSRLLSRKPRGGKHHIGAGYHEA